MQLTHPAGHFVQIDVAVADLDPPVHFVERWIQHKLWQIVAVGFVVQSSDVEKGPLPPLHRLQRLGVWIAGIGVGVDCGCATLDHHFLRDWGQVDASWIRQNVVDRNHLRSEVEEPVHNPKLGRTPR